MLSFQDWEKDSTFLWLLMQITRCVRFRVLWAPHLTVQTLDDDVSPLISLLWRMVSFHRSVGEKKVYESVLEIMDCGRKPVTDIFLPSSEVPLFSAQSTNVRPTPIWCSIFLCFPPDCTPKALQAIKRNAVCFVLQDWFKKGEGEGCNCSPLLGTTTVKTRWYNVTAQC